MIQALHYRRLFFLGLCLLAGFAWLGRNLYHIQIVRHRELAAKAERSFVFNRTLPPVRGEIRDRHNRILAVNEPVKSVFVNPCLLDDQRQDMARLLAFWMQTSPQEVLPYLWPKLLRLNERGAPVFDTKVRLKTRVSWEDWGRLRRLLDGHCFGFDPRSLTPRQQARLRRLRTQAVFAEDDQIRLAPHGALAAHVIGYLGFRDGAPTLTGLCGIEGALDEYLRGFPGQRHGERDGLGREVLLRRTLDLRPVDGLHVVLTLDLVAQQILEAELASALGHFQAKAGVGIIVQPRTGRILALVSLPAYNLQDLRHVPADAWQNRAIASVYEPGSTFKIVVFSALLNEGLASLDTLVDCGTGSFQYHGTRLTDARPLGVVPCSTAFALSSSVGAARLGLYVGAERLHRYAAAFGFGEPTGILLPFERAGILRPVKEWSAISPTRIAIGYEVGVTPLQMILAMCAIANEGRLMRPLLVERLEDNQGHIVAQAVPRVVRQVISPAAAREMVRALKAVLADPGTGRLAGLDEWPAAGKTGTAFKFDGTHYDRSRRYASFCGFFPADAPEACILIVLDEPQLERTGGHAAAPVFRNVGTRLARYLQLPPEGAALASAGFGVPE
jgi:cell division protein FtsI (penicillin-binding protein 3)